MFRLVLVLSLAVLASSDAGFPWKSKFQESSKGAAKHKAKDWMGRSLHEGAATDPTTPAGLVDRFLVEAKLQPDNLPKQTDPDKPLPNRHMYTWYTRGGRRTTMIVDDEKRFDFDLTHPPPYETAGVNMVYYARRLDQQLLTDAKNWMQEYGYESALRRLKEVKGSQAKLNPASPTNHFAPTIDVQGNRKERDWLPSSPQRAYLRIVFVSDNPPPPAQIETALRESTNIVVFKLFPTYLKQLWPTLKRAPRVFSLSSSSSSSSVSLSSSSKSASSHQESSEPSTKKKLEYIRMKWRKSWLAEKGSHSEQSQGSHSEGSHSEQSQVSESSHHSNSTDSNSSSSSKSGSSQLTKL